MPCALRLAQQISSKNLYLPHVEGDEESLSDRVEGSHDSVGPTKQFLATRVTEIIYWPMAWSEPAKIEMGDAAAGYISQ